VRSLRRGPDGPSPAAAQDDRHAHHPGEKATVAETAYNGGRHRAPALPVRQLVSRSVIKPQGATMPRGPTPRAGGAQSCPRPYVDIST
jgi:hypothetical protein